MQAAKHRSWQISVHCKAANFHLKFRAFLAFLPNSSIARIHLTLFLTIRRFCLNMLLRSRDHPQNPDAVTSKFRLIRFFRRFNTRAVGKKRKKSTRGTQLVKYLPKQLLSEDSMAAVIGGLALLSNSVAQMNYEAIALHVFTISFYLILLLRKFSTRKIHFLLLLLAILASSVALSLHYLNYKGPVSLAIWKEGSHLISFGCLYVVTQARISRLSQSMGRNKFVILLILALLSVLLNLMTG